MKQEQGGGKERKAKRGSVEDWTEEKGEEQGKGDKQDRGGREEWK